MHNRRKRLVVDRHAQTRMVIAISWPLSLVIGSLGLFLGVVSGKLAAQAVLLNADAPTIPTLALAVAGFTLLATGFVVYMAVRFSNRVAGPSYRIVKTIEAIRAGELDLRIRLRTGDYLQDVAREINALLDTVQACTPDHASSAAPATAGEPSECATVTAVER